MNRKKTEREDRHKWLKRNYTFYAVYNEIRKIKDVFGKMYEALAYNNG